MTRKEQAKRDQRLREAILGYISARPNMTRATFAARIGMSESTLTRRLQCPKMFTLGELRRVDRLLGGVFDV